MALLLSNCQVGPNYTNRKINAPEEWKNPPPLAGDVCDYGENWWSFFQDDLLTELIETALENNRDFFAAYERIVQARAIAGERFSDLLPDLSFQPSFHDQITLYRQFDPTRITRAHIRRQATPIVLNYEIDLWGKYRKAYESAADTIEAEYEAFKTTLLLLTTDLAQSYFRVRMLDAEIDYYQNEIKALQDAVDITTSRYELQTDDYSPVARAKLDLSNTKASYEEAVRERGVEENRVAMLAGLAAPNFHLEPLPLGGAPPLIPVGLPSSILLQRPDLAEAERRMASEHALIGVAYASFFPTLSLTGILGFSSPELKDFLKWRSRLWSIAAESFLPIFDGGLRRSQLMFAFAKFREARDHYLQMVVQVFQEVEDSLVSLEQLDKEYIEIQDSVDSAQEVFQIAHDRYDVGMNSYLEVTLSERDKIESQIELIELLGDRYFATIQLIKSIGGSWGTFSDVVHCAIPETTHLDP